MGAEIPDEAVALLTGGTQVAHLATSREILHRINRRYGADDDEWAENTAVRIEVGSANYWTYD